MSSARPKPCIVCGRRVTGGSPRCELHQQGSGRQRPCLVCGRPSQGNYCADHEPKVDEQLRNERNPYRQAYKSAEYATNRQHRYERARGRCEGCGLPVGPGEWQCDHIVTVARWTRERRAGSANDIGNLQILCIVPRTGAPSGCHGLKTKIDRKGTL